jgi:hypothetical protein
VVEAEMMKIYSLIAAAALLAGAVMAAPGLVSASSRHELSTQTTSGKGDRLDIAVRLTCKQQSWPYLDRSCVIDPRTESGSARKVRVVSADRK